MKENWLEILNGAGVDTEGAIRRFCGKEVLYKRFVSQFLTDENFQKAKEAISIPDWKQYASAIHALKGVTGTLGFQDLFRITSQMMEDLREDRYEPAEKLFPELEENYHKISAALKQAFENEE